MLDPEFSFRKLTAVAYEFALPSHGRAFLFKLLLEPFGVNEVVKLVAFLAVSWFGVPF